MQKPPFFLQGVIESLIDGVLILSDSGALIHANQRAQNLCREIDAAVDAVTSIPDALWRICQALIDGREWFADGSTPVIIEDEISLDHRGSIRVRARWLHTEGCPSYLLVTLEDRVQSAQYRALAEAHRYQLTQREAEVWLLKRAEYTYKAIAAQLHIAEDTVKKHIKSIYAKREAAQWSEA